MEGGARVVVDGSWRLPESKPETFKHKISIFVFVSLFTSFVNWIWSTVYVVKLNVEIQWLRIIHSVVNHDVLWSNAGMGCQRLLQNTLKHVTDTNEYISITSLSFFSFVSPDKYETFFKATTFSPITNPDSSYSNESNYTERQIK